MRIFRALCYDADHGALLSWHPNKVQAEKYLDDFQKGRGEPATGPEGVEEFQIPSSKRGLIEWLNNHFTTDNGLW